MENNNFNFPILNKLSLSSSLLDFPISPSPLISSIKTSNNNIPQKQPSSSLPSAYGAASSPPPSHLPSSSLYPLSARDTTAGPSIVLPLSHLGKQESLLDHTKNTVNANHDQDGSTIKTSNTETKDSVEIDVVEIDQLHQTESNINIKNSMIQKEMNPFEKSFANPHPLSETIENTSKIEQFLSLSSASELKIKSKTADLNPKDGVIIHESSSKMDIHNSSIDIPIATQTVRSSYDKPRPSQSGVQPSQNLVVITTAESTPINNTETNQALPPTPSTQPVSPTTINQNISCVMEEDKEDQLPLINNLNPMNSSSFSYRIQGIPLTTSSKTTSNFLLGSTSTTAAYRELQQRSYQVQKGNWPSMSESSFSSEKTASMVPQENKFPSSETTSMLMPQYLSNPVTTCFPTSNSAVTSSANVMTIENPTGNVDLATATDVMSINKGNLPTKGYVSGDLHYSGISRHSTSNSTSNNIIINSKMTPSLLKTAISNPNNNNPEIQMNNHETRSKTMSTFIGTIEIVPSGDDLNKSNLPAKKKAGRKRKVDEGLEELSEKKKLSLERNRQAAMKCRQRKKEWLASLENKVGYLTQDNSILEEQASALKEEILNLKTLLLAHKDCKIALANGLDVKAIESTLLSIHNKKN